LSEYLDFQPYLRILKINLLATNRPLSCLL